MLQFVPLVICKQTVRYCAPLHLFFAVEHACGIWCPVPPQSSVGAYSDQSARRWVADSPYEMCAPLAGRERQRGGGRVVVVVVREGYIQNSRTKFSCWGREGALKAMGCLWIWFKPCYQRSQAAHYYMKCILKGIIDVKVGSNANPLQQVQECWLRECYEWFSECFLTAAVDINEKSLFFLYRYSVFKRDAIVMCFHIRFAIKNTHKNPPNHNLSKSLLEFEKAKNKLDYCCIYIE